jgi:hypothetical protein
VNYLTFESFISIPVLIGIYYLGVLFIPTVLWFQRDRIKTLLIKLQQYTPVATSRVLWITIIMFLIAEVIWRMMFEMIIGYFQMREYLQHLVG